MSVLFSISSSLSPLSLFYPILLVYKPSVTGGRPTEVFKLTINLMLALLFLPSGKSKVKKRGKMNILCSIDVMSFMGRMLGKFEIGQLPLYSPTSFDLK